MSLAVKKYAKALFEVCKEENCLEEVYEQYKQIDIELKQNSELNKIMNTEILSVEQKQSLFENALKGGNQYLLNFLKILTQKERTNELREMFTEFEELYKDEKNILEVSAVTAVELSSDEADRIKQMLETKYKKTIYLTCSVDPSIIGGMMLYVGDTVLDASVRAKLNGLRNQMKQIKLT